MIIVKTTNGDQFINDATVNRVAHNKDTHTVTIHKGTVGTFQYAEHTIEHVEGVIYTNEAQATQWHDEGSLIKKLQGIIDQQKHEPDKAYHDHERKRQIRPNGRGCHPRTPALVL